MILSDYKNLLIYFLHYLLLKVYFFFYFFMRYLKSLLNFVIFKQYFLIIFLIIYISMCLYLIANYLKIKDWDFIIVSENSKQLRLILYLNFNLVQLKYFLSQNFSKIQFYLQKMDLDFILAYYLLRFNYSHLDIFDLFLIIFKNSMFLQYLFSNLLLILCYWIYFFVNFI